jgi:hypothetical protein
VQVECPRPCHHLELTTVGVWPPPAVGIVNGMMVAVLLALVLLAAAGGGVVDSQLP